jgi:hypothetical protein
MRQLKYNSATNVLRFEFPVEWEGDDITGVTLAIHDKSGTELLAADALTLYTATELDGAVDKHLNEIVLDSAAGALSPGDPILIDGIAGPERNRVKGYDSSTFAVTLESILDNDHADADAVYGLWGTYTLDTTTVATWTAGLIVTLTWTPAGSGQATTELAQISKSVVEIEGLAKRFSRVYPRAFRSFTESVDRLADMLDEAKRRVEKDMLAENMVMNRTVDQDVLSEWIMAKMAHLWALNGDKDLEDERKVLSKECEIEKQLVYKLPIWADHNQDKIEDAEEVTDHIRTFGRGW